MPPLIPPVIGRMVHVYAQPGIMVCADHQTTPRNLIVREGHPLAGQICYVWSDRMVNVRVIDHDGHAFGLTSVRLLQEGDEPSGEPMFATWMPFQIGQAAKTEQLQEQLRQQSGQTQPEPAAANATIATGTAGDVPVGATGKYMREGDADGEAKQAIPGETNNAETTTTTEPQPGNGDASPPAGSGA